MISMNKLAVALCGLMLWGSAVAEVTIKLPEPNAKKALKMTLGKTLQKRHSVRSFSKKTVDDQTLSTLLWAACGFNRPQDKRITAPSAINAQDIVVLVCRADGTFRYRPKTNELVKVTDKDLRVAVAGKQEYAKEAPFFLLLLSDLYKFKNPQTAKDFGAMDAGYVSENICLACTAMGLATVPRFYMDRETLTKELGVADFQILELNHPIGWPGK